MNEEYNKPSKIFIIMINLKYFFFNLNSTYHNITLSCRLATTLLVYIELRLRPNQTSLTPRAVDTGREGSPPQHIGAVFYWDWDITPLLTGERIKERERAALCDINMEDSVAQTDKKCVVHEYECDSEDLKYYRLGLISNTFAESLNSLAYYQDG